MVPIHFWYFTSGVIFICHVFLLGMSHLHAHFTGLNLYDPNELCSFRIPVELDGFVPFVALDVNKGS